MFLTCPNKIGDFSSPKTQDQVSAYAFDLQPM